MPELEDISAEIAETRRLLVQSRNQLDMGLWTTDRVNRLAHRIGCPLAELCAHAGVYEKSKVKRMAESGKWPPSVVMHLWRLERFMSGLRGRSALDDRDEQMINYYGRPKGS